MNVKIIISMEIKYIIRMNVNKQNLLEKDLQV